MSKFKELIEERKQLAEKARVLLDKGKNGYTTQQLEEVKELSSKVKELDGKISRHKESQDLLDSIKGESEPVTGDHVYLDRSSKTLRAKGAEIRNLIQTKALIGVGTQPIAATFTEEPVMLPGQTAYALTQLLPHKIIASSNYQYLRQTVRDHKAAVVPVGSQKPESDYEFAAVKGDLAIIAHLSKPFHEFWIRDFPEAIEALNTEMLHGIFEKLEDLIVNGSGTGGNPTGILNTSGIQTQAYATDQLTTTRTAVTKLEMLGYNAGAFVLNPMDWQNIELTRDSSGQLEYNSGPIDRSAMRLWGVPVATSTHVLQGTGIALDLDAAHVVTDNSINLLATNANKDDIEYNQMRIRGEGRWDIAVTKPQGIVKMTLSS